MKKIIAAVLILLILWNGISLQVSSGSFSDASFLLNDVQSDTYELSPGQSFSIQTLVANDVGDDIKNVSYSVSFGNNQGFQYSGENQGIFLNNKKYSNSISADAYSSAHGFSTVLTSDAIPTVGMDNLFGVAPVSRSKNSFSVLKNIATYENNGMMRIEGKKVSNDEVVSYEKNIVFYANVKPHVMDYYFEKASSGSLQITNQVQGSNAEPFHFVAKIKDYNGCENIDGGSVVADLSFLGLKNNEPLTYVGCEGDGFTAIFKKSDITTDAALGTYSFLSSMIQAKDEDGNEFIVNDTQTSFDDEDKKMPSVITIVKASAPVVVLDSISQSAIGGPSKTSTFVQLKANQNTSLKVVVGSDGSCSSGSVLQDWTPGYEANTLTGVTIASDRLQEGTNSITTCFKNSGDTIGSTQFFIVKDTQKPQITPLLLSPYSIILGDSKLQYTCGEDGEYAVRMGENNLQGLLIASGSTQAQKQIEVPLANGLFTLGKNIFTGYCIDSAGNSISATGSIIKSPPTPPMGAITGFSDSDVDYQGISGRDISFSYDNNLSGFTAFESFLIYVLPSNISLDTSKHTPIDRIFTPGNTKYVGGDKILKDSLGNTFVNGGSYHVCMAILGTTGMIGTSSCSSSNSLQADTVTNPKVMGAKFIASDKLELTLDAVLDARIGVHSGTGVSYVVGGNRLQTQSIVGINGNRAVFSIPSLSNPDVTGGNIIVATGSLRANGGGFNNYFSDSNVVITDGQTPIVKNFQKTTPADYSTFYSKGFELTYEFLEKMSGNSTKLVFERVSGNNSPIKNLLIQEPSSLTIGIKNMFVSLPGIGLISGVEYMVKMVATDIAGNIGQSEGFLFKFDNVGPEKVVLIDQKNTAETTPTVRWKTAQDDFGNGSGVKDYLVKVYADSSCQTPPVQTFTTSQTSQKLNTLSDGAYGFGVTARDNVGNMGTPSDCDSFVVDTSIATISQFSGKDISLGDTYTKNGNNIQLQAKLLNTNTDNIVFDISSLAGRDAYKSVVCSQVQAPITCMYNNGDLQLAFPVGFAGGVKEGVRQIGLQISNAHQTSQAQSLISFTQDSVSPVGIQISQPVEGGVYGGKNLSINYVGGTDVNLKNIEFQYSKNAGASYVSIGTSPANGKFDWDISSLVSGTQYKLKMIATDASQNQAIAETSVFSIDKDAPILASGLITSPVPAQMLSGNKTFTLEWNPSKITDDSALPSLPISWYYSSDNGGNYYPVVQGIPNSGTYVWNVPNLNSHQVKLKMLVKDSVGNETAREVGPFFVDAISPTLNIEYAGGESYAGTTPPNGSYVNQSGVDVSLSTYDIYFKEVSYSLQEVESGKYFNGESFQDVLSWNTLCGDTAVGGNSGNCNAIKVPLVFPVAHEKKYTFVVRSSDEAGNISLSPPIEWKGDIQNPNISFSTSSGTYLASQLHITGSAGDAQSGVSTVKIAIKKGNTYWNGTSFVNELQQLAVHSTDSYKNWSYDFVLPNGENNQQEYEVIAYAYDKAYKNNGTTQTSIRVITDFEGPTIQNNIFTFDTSKIYSGGESIRIEWDPSKISDSGVGLDPQGFTLGANFGNGYMVIALNIANTGTYDFVLPQVDTTTAKFFISASDRLGNLSSPIGSHSFVVDSTDPQIEKVMTKGDGMGKTSGLIVMFSEKIKNPGLLSVANIFSIAGGTMASTYSYAEVDGKTHLEINFAQSIDGTSVTPSLVFQGNIIEDYAGRKLHQGTLQSIDNAEPRMVEASIFDEDKNGKFDMLTLKMSEDMQSTQDVSGVQFENPLLGLSPRSLQVQGNLFKISLQEGQNITTALQGMKAIFISQPTYRDKAGNLAGSNGSSVNILDKAGPVYVSAVISGAGYEAQSVTLTASEDIQGPVTGFAVSSGVLSPGILSGKNIVFPISGLGGTTFDVRLSYSGTLSDVSGNPFDAFDMKLTETIPPKGEWVKTLDTNNNGKIDGIQLHLSEGLSGNFDDFFVTVEGYSLASVGKYVFYGKQDIIINVEEKPLYDTAMVPKVFIQSNHSVTDESGNVFPSGNTYQTIDGVGPVISGARYDEGEKKIYVTMSEKVVSSLDNSSFSMSGVNAQILSVHFVPGEKSAVITLDSSGVIYGVSSLSLQKNVAFDANQNAQSDLKMSFISPSVFINEVMRDEDLKYIELRNLSSSSVNISGWKIENMYGSGSDYTFPENSIISGNGYYLIANNSDYFDGITPDRIENISFVGDISLTSGQTVLDTFVLQPSQNNTALERYAGCGNGADIGCYYTAVAKNGFSDTSFFGTPKTKNIVDNTSPIVTSFSPTQDNILPTKSQVFNMSFDYQDNVGGVGIDPGSAQLKIKKYQSGDWMNTSLVPVQKSITQTKATYEVSGFSQAGRYQAQFVLGDLAGNEVIQTIDFYVDDFKVAISTNSIVVPGVRMGKTQFTQTGVMLTVQTIGSSFALDHTLDAFELPMYNSGSGLGGCIGESCTTLENYASKRIIEQSKDVQTSGELKTYSFPISYGVTLGEDISAGNYSTKAKYRILYNP